jgi:hypothetical protein
MIKLVHVFRRLPSLTLEECQRYWREKHSKLVLRHAKRFHVLRYVQVHTIDDPLNEMLRASRGEIEPYDGIELLWFENRKALEMALAKPAGRQAMKELVEDERRFMDHQHSSIWLAEEHIFIKGAPGGTVASEESSIVKLSFVFRRLPNLSLQECQSYWRDVHGQRVLQQASGFPLRRYVQTHTLEDPLNDILRTSRNAGEIYDGVAEMWGVLDELASAAATPEGQRAAEEFLEDERRFIDPTCSSVWLGKEHVVIEGH